MRRLIQKQYIFGVLGILCILISLLADNWLRPALYKSYTSESSELVQHAVIAKEKEADSFLIKASKITPVKLPNAFEKLYDESKQHHILFYITRIDGTIIYYSNNSVFPTRILISPLDSELQHLPNGYYLQKNIAANGLIYVELIPVKYEYAFENQYLKNYIPFLKDNNDFTILKSAGSGFPIYNSSHHYLFSLLPNKTVEPFNWIIYLFVIGFILLLFFVDQRISSLLSKRRNLYGLIVFAAFNALFVFFWKITRWPSDLYRWPIFSSHYYGSSSLFSSLGDILFFSAIIFYAFRFISKIRIKLRINPILAIVGFGLLLIGSFFFSAEIGNLINSLVLDSIIPFDLGNIFSINFYSVVGIIIIFIFIGCYFIYLNLFIKALRKHIGSSSNFFLALSVSMFITATLLSLTPVSFYIAFLFNAICVVLGYYRPKLFGKNWIVYVMTSMAVASLFISVVLSKYNEQKQDEEQESTARKVISERDPVAGYLFANIYNEIQKDEYIKNFFKSPLVSEAILSSRIQQVYLSGYFGKYDIDVSTFTTDGNPYKNPLDKPLAFYTNILEKEGEPESSNNLYYLHTHTGLSSYISKIQISSNGVFLGTILIQMQQKPFYEESVYPELLVSENLGKFRELDNYSYAVYSNGILLNQKGEYPYPGVQNFRIKLDSNNSAEFNEGGYTHLVHQPHANLLVIVSTQSPGLLYYVSSFAFVFLFMAIGFIIILFIPYFIRLLRIVIIRNGYSFRNGIGFSRLSFRNKILITVISGMTISMLLIGFVTVSYISYQYNKDELDRLRKKTRLITTRLSSDFQQNERKLAFVGPDIRTIVKSLSDIYQADINVFDVKGNLISSTESAIYDKLIIAPKMDALANIKFNTDLVSQVIQEERIGQLKFTSCYMPIRNVEGQVIGYLNLPYFSKEQELKNRISSFLEALVNLYLLLFLILVILGIFITRVLTAPLDIIRNHLRSTNLTGTNEFIAWNTNDEIGKLVKEYNSMILALKESAERLAQSEREGALKELAQHVAHEIKNPLTPMKLGIQQLQNAYYKKDNNYDALFKKVTEMIIRQIDTLSAIATDFNDSAKIGTPEPVNINALLHQITDLFSHNLVAQVSLDIDAPAETKVFADHNKLTRVFTNLVNNAVQSIPENKQGLVTIRNNVIEDKVIITVEDNGSGIPEPVRKKIFIPNFSTKSAGTGLGLAISKAIIEQAGGTITFTSVVDKGSVFKVELPLYENY